MFKQNKILATLGLTTDSTAQHSTAQHSTIGLATRRLVQISALTISCMVSMPSFAQNTYCEWSTDEDGSWYRTCHYVGTGGSSIMLKPKHPWDQGCQGIACDSSEGGDGDDTPDDCSNKSNGLGKDGEQCDNDNLAQCLAVSRQKTADNCTTDFESEDNIPWSAYTDGFQDSLNIDQFLPGPPSETWYNDLIDGISGEYWSNPTSQPVIEYFWMQAISYCFPYPSIGNDGTQNGSASNPTYASCMSSAYELSFAFAPELSAWAFDFYGLSRYGISIRILQAGNPLGNWAHNHYLEVNRLKRCVNYYREEERLGCDDL